MRYTPRQSSKSAAAGKAAIAAASAALMFAAFGGTSFAAAPSRPADSPVCGVVGGVVATVGQVCTSVVDALPVPDLGSGASGGSTNSALPALPGLPDLGSVLPALPSGDASGGSSALPGLPDLGSVLPALTGVLPTGALPTGALPTGAAPSTAAPAATPTVPGLPTGALPTGALPSLAAVPAAVATLFNTVDPIIGTLHDSLPDQVTSALPVDTLTGALSPVVTPVLGAVNSVGKVVTTALPITGPIVNPVLDTLNALPGQLNTALGTLANGQQPATTTPAVVPVSVPALPLVATGDPSSAAVAPEPEVNPDRSPAAQDVAQEPAVQPAATPTAAVAPKSGSGGDSLPVTGIGFAGVGLAGAIALSWGSFARSLAARRKVLPEG
ncbi:MAG: hypothetical protein JWM34_692 [Ilumatobacteraceae bacterium]|nr:hypothetical protein [Ilumatobacteraceae bacterium]